MEEREGRVEKGKEGGQGKGGGREERKGRGKEGG